MCRSVRWLALMFILRSIAAFAADEPINACVKGIDSINSYDVKFTLSFLQPKHSSDLKKTDDATEVALITTNRDVFASGLGRRIEQSLGDKDSQDIGVIDWKTIKAKRGLISRAIRTSSPGLTYLDYLNPEDDSPFLTEWLRDPHSKISALEGPESKPGTVGFKVEHFRMHGQIRLWLDAEHGYMPSRIEFCVRNQQGVVSPVRRIRVEKFAQTDAGNWVPAVAINELIQSSGPAAGCAYAGEKMELDNQHCSWNKVKDDALFAASNLTNKNYSDNGWTHFDAPTLLQALQVANQMRVIPSTDKKAIVRILYVILIMLPLATILFMNLKNRRKASI